MASRTITPLPSSLRTQTSPNLSSPFMGVVNSDSIENNNLRNVLKGERVPTVEDRENLERRILSYDLINRVTMEGTLDLFLSGKTGPLFPISISNGFTGKFLNKLVKVAILLIIQKSDIQTERSA